MTTTDVPTFTGDELDWKPVDDGKNSDAINVNEEAKEPVVEVVKEEDVDFGNEQEEANFEKIKASEDEANIHNLSLKPRKDLLVAGAVEASEAEQPPPIHKARAKSGEKKRSKSRSTRARSVRVQELAPTAPKRSASRPPAKSKGRSGGPIRPLEDRSPITPLSPKSRKDLEKLWRLCQSLLHYPQASQKLLCSKSWRRTSPLTGGLSSTFT